MLSALNACLQIIVDVTLRIISCVGCCTRMHAQTGRDPPLNCSSHEIFSRVTCVVLLLSYVHVGGWWSSFQTKEKHGMSFSSLRRSCRVGNGKETTVELLISRPMTPTTCLKFASEWLRHWREYVLPAWIFHCRRRHRRCRQRCNETIHHVDPFSAWYFLRYSFKFNSLIRGNQLQHWIWAIVSMTRYCTSWVETYSEQYNVRFYMVDLETGAALDISFLFRFEVTFS